MSMRFRPRPDRGSPPHERARELVAERLDGALEPAEAAWLDGHLAGCHACRSLAEAYAADRVELQGLGRYPIEPPRDLWARTSVALEQEAGAAVGARAGVARRRLSPAPVGAAAGLAIVAVVMGASILSSPQQRTLPSVPASSHPLTAATTQPTARPQTTPGPTPLAIPSGAVPYVALDDDGNTSLFFANVSEVCAKDSLECAPVVASSPLLIDLPDSPHTVIRSPVDGQLVVVGEGATDTGGTVVLVPVPTPSSSAPPPLPPSPPPSTSPCPSPVSPECTGQSPEPAPTPSATATAVPSLSVAPSTNVEPTDSASPVPTTDTSLPSVSPTPSVTPPLPVSASPSATESPAPTDSSSPSPTESAAPGSPSPTSTAAATPFAIAEGVIVDAGTAAFSPEDGRFLAFSARPADGSHGPDIYVWTAGDTLARAMTKDHRSVFAGWLGDTILGSRVVEETPAAEGEAPSADPSASSGPVSSTPTNVPLRPEAFLLDPTTGEATPIAGRRVWRPSADPTGMLAVYWDGSLEVDESGAWQTVRGRLVVGPWSGLATEPPSDDADTPVEVLEEGPIATWDAQWDETGTHLAIWIADPDDPTIGKLSLYVVDPDAGRLQPDAAPLRDERALAGFAIGDGRLVWATPPGQNAEGSHVSVLAWTAAGMGQVETQPAEDIVVVR